MNRAETIAVMAVLKVAYPAYYHGKTEAELQAAISLWQEMFSDDDAGIVTAAVKMFIATDEKGFPPNIGVIKSQISKLLAKDTMSEQQAWNLALKAVANGYYNAREEFDRLPARVQRILGGPETIREWGRMEESELNTVVASNFMRSYRALAEREKYENAVPQEVRDMVSASEVKALNGAEMGLDVYNSGRYDYDEIEALARQKLELQLGKGTKPCGNPNTTTKKP